MTVSAQEQLSGADASFDSAWQAVRDDAEIQFSPAERPEPEDPPQWWEDFTKWLNEVFGPAAEFVADAWPVIRIVLIVLLAAGALTLLWVILRPYVDDWRGRKQVEAEDWQPEHAVARRLLEEADALAGKGQFEEAVHLLLYRSIEHIEERRPDLLRPSSTAREIGRFDGLPESARAMFAVIAGHVERGIFGASPIGETGWNAAREAYGSFALAETWRSS